MTNHHHHLLLSPMGHRASTKRLHLVLSLAAMTKAFDYIFFQPNSDVFVSLAKLNIYAGLRKE